MCALDVVGASRKSASLRESRAVGRVQDQLNGCAGAGIVKVKDGAPRKFTGLDVIDENQIGGSELSSAVEAGNDCQLPLAVFQRLSSA